MSLFTFHIIPFSAKSAGKELFSRGEWNLYKIQWKTDKKMPKMFAELTVPVSGNVITLLYNKKMNSLQDPFGWNDNCEVDDQTKKLLQTALELSDRVI